MVGINDLIGKNFGKWTVISFSHKDKYYQKYWICRCTCGVEKSIQQAQLINGYSVRCRACAYRDRRIYKPIAIGEKYGKWTVVAFTDRPSFVIARCDCGNTKPVNSQSLLYGNSLKCPSCRGRDANIKHGHNCKGKVTQEYRAWCNMKNRCINPNCEQYKNYGGRNIGIFPKWLNSFEVFLADVGPAPSKEYSLERRDPYGNYEPGNVYWVFRSNQVLNRRIMYVYKDKKISLRSLSKKYKVQPKMIKKLLFRANYSLRGLKEYSKLNHFQKTQFGIFLNKNIVLSIDELKKIQNSNSSKRHPYYYRWHSIIQRCYNPENKDYVNYGGRGIKVDPILQTFDGFRYVIEKSLGPKPTENSQLDRMNTDGDYSLSNLRWATPTEQAINKRSALKINGQSVSISKIKRELNISPRAISILIKNGWNEDGLVWYSKLAFKEKKEKAILSKRLQQHEAMNR